MFDAPEKKAPVKTAAALPVKPSPGPVSFWAKLNQNFKWILIVVLVLGIAAVAALLFLNYQKDVSAVKEAVKTEQEKLLAQKARLDQLKE